LLVSSLVHFLNIVTGNPACFALPDSEPLVAYVDPKRVSCPECLRYLRGEFRGNSPERPSVAVQVNVPGSRR
jgi:hypothetical protein